MEEEDDTGGYPESFLVDASTIWLGGFATRNCKESMSNELE